MQDQQQLQTHVWCDRLLRTRVLSLRFYICLALVKLSKNSHLFLFSSPGIKFKNSPTLYGFFSPYEHIEQNHFYTLMKKFPPPSRSYDSVGLKNPWNRRAMWSGLLLFASQFVGVCWDFRITLQTCARMSHSADVHGEKWTEHLFRRSVIKNCAKCLNLRLMMRNVSFYIMQHFKQLNKI